MSFAPHADMLALLQSSAGCFHLFKVKAGAGKIVSKTSICHDHSTLQSLSWTHDALLLGKQLCPRKINVFQYSGNRADMMCLISFAPR